MRLDAEHALAPATLAAMRDLAVPEAAEVDDAALLRLALGIADAPTRLACARALLASPSTVRRLVAIRARLRDGFGGGVDSGEDRADLERLAAFEGPFRFEAAAAVFPRAFRDPERLLRLVDDGWLTLVDEGAFGMPSDVRALFLPSTHETEEDSGWRTRFVEHFVDRAKRIDGLMAESRWVEGSAELGRSLPNVQAAWRFAAGLGTHDAVAEFVRTLAIVLIESGRSSVFADLATHGYRAADALGDPRLRTTLLSLEGVVAAREGDSARARTLWNERLVLSRRIGNHAAVADVLMDLLEQDLSDGDHDAYARRKPEADAAVAVCGRADFDATLRTLESVDALGRGDRECALDRAELALATLTGASGILFGLGIRLGVAKSFARCDRADRAVAVLSETLELSIGGGRNVPAAIVLSEIAPFFARRGLTATAARCLALALRIHRQVGTRRVESAERALAEFLAEHPDLPDAEAMDRLVQGRWETRAEEILKEIDESFSKVAKA